MSTFSCPLSEFTLEKHPNADSLSIAKVGGWQCVVKTENFSPEDTCGVYIPLDAIAATDHPLLGFLNGKRVETCKLRGVISQGILLPKSEVEKYCREVRGMSDQSIEKVFVIGKDFSGILGVKKWYSYTHNTSTSGAAVHGDPRFHKYTDIENIKNYRDVISFGEDVHISEKLHGTSARYAVFEDVEKVLIASRNNQLRDLDPDSSKSTVWHAIYESHKIKDVLSDLQDHFKTKNIGLYGEIVGQGIQDLRYGTLDHKFYAYDIMKDGEYVDPLTFENAISAIAKIPSCPVLKIGQFFESDILLKDGQSLLDNSHVREGIVIKPLVPRFERSLGRVVLKVISENFLLRKNGKDNTLE